LGTPSPRATINASSRLGPRAGDPSHPPTPRAFELGTLSPRAFELGAPESPPTAPQPPTALQPPTTLQPPPARPTTTNHPGKT
jgi:hypothetical protein